MAIASSSWRFKSFIYTLLAFAFCSNWAFFRFVSSKSARILFFSDVKLSNYFNMIFFSLSELYTILSNSWTLFCRTFIAAAIAPFPYLFPYLLWALSCRLSPLYYLCLPSSIVIFCLARCIDEDSILSIDSLLFEASCLKEVSETGGKWGE